MSLTHIFDLMCFLFAQWHCNHHSNSNYHIYLNVRQQFSPNLSSENWEGHLIILHNVKHVFVGLCSSRMCYHITRCLAPNVSWGCLKVSGTNHPVTWCHIPEE
jgi:hypothetical protein